MLRRSRKGSLVPSIRRRVKLKRAFARNYSSQNNYCRFMYVYTRSAPCFFFFRFFAFSSSDDTFFVILVGFLLAWKDRNLKVEI